MGGYELDKELLEAIRNRLEARRQARMDDDGWVTIKGTHVLLKNGVAVGGGKLNGMTFSNAKSTSKPKPPKSNSMDDPGLSKFKEGYGKGPIDLDEIYEVPVKKLNKKLTEDEIINRIAGGDKTKGSCMSLALAYAANKAGLDVLDFRGGKSQKFFSNSRTIEGLYKAGVEMFSGERMGYKGVIDIFTNLKPNKEYIAILGCHAAIVRLSKTEKGGVEYLELQSGNKSRNGWHSTTGKLKSRFKVDKYFGWSYAIDVDSLSQYGGLSELMSYINTPRSEQQKGRSGRMK